MIQLRTQQAELLRQRAALTVTYGPKHPKLLAADNQLHDLDQKIGEEGARIASALANDVAVARAQLGSLKGSLDSTQRTASGQDLTAVKLRALEAEADSSRKLYESFLSRLTAIQDQEGLQYPDAHVISRAPVPNAPSSPPRMLIVLAAIPAGLLVGCLAALLSVRLAGTTRVAPAVRPAVRPSPRPAPQPAPAYRGPPILADVPGAHATGAADHVIDWPASPFARAVGALLARVVPVTRTGSARIVSVTTSQDDASGATVALALARAAAQTGLRTILVDGHMIHPMLARLTGVQAQAGIMDVLRGSAPLNRALARDPRSSALFLGALRPPRDPQLALASPRTQELFAHLRGICDLVVIATPPVLSAQETPYFARLSDAVVMVARPEDGPKPTLAHALKALVEWHSAPVGMVLVR
jgi:polysaccharide biosynthesis transport protein